jgi:hypothetical protein
MATTRKSAKRAAGKKSGSRSASARKKTARKKTASRRSGPKAKETARPRRKSSTTLRKRAAKGLRAAQGGVETVKQAGDKIWESLRATTTQVVEGVRDRFGEDTDRSTPSSR